MTDVKPSDLQESLRWLKKVAGVDDEYIERWPTGAWEQWSRAMRSDRHGPNPTVPGWMQPILGPWSWDFSGPFPCVAQLWPTAHDWFAETDAHPDFTLRVSGAQEDGPPSLNQLREAWSIARARGATPLMSISVVPAEPWGAAVEGEVEAFYVVGSPLGAELLEELARILGPTALSSVTVGNATELMTYAGRESIDGGELRAWEWMYG